MANTLTKSDEWIHEKEWRIVIKDDINIGKSGIIKDFVLPREIYIGCRQQETVAENNNNRMLHSKKRMRCMLIQMRYFNGRRITILMYICQ